MGICLLDSSRKEAVSCSPHGESPSHSTCLSLSSITCLEKPLQQLEQVSSHFWAWTQIFFHTSPKHLSLLFFFVFYFHRETPEKNPFYSNFCSLCHIQSAVPKQKLSPFLPPVETSAINSPSPLNQVYLSTYLQVFTLQTYVLDKAKVCVGISCQTDLQLEQDITLPPAYPLPSSIPLQGFVSSFCLQLLPCCCSELLSAWFSISIFQHLPLSLTSLILRLDHYLPHSSRTTQVKKKKALSCHISSRHMLKYENAYYCVLQ